MHIIIFTAFVKAADLFFLFYCSIFFYLFNKSHYEFNSIFGLSYAYI